MAIELTNENIDYAVSEYLAGASVSELCKHFNTRFPVIRKALTGRGVKIRDRGEQKSVSTVRRFESALPDFLETYNSGLGLSKCCEIHGFHVALARREMEARGIHVRNASEQQSARMKNVPIEILRERAKRNGVGIRGKSHSFDSLCKRAEARFKNGTVKRSPIEDEFAGIMAEHGLDFIAQKNIGPYNCDFVVGSVAVEIWGGQFHFTGLHAERSPARFKYILNRGFDAVIIHVESANGLTRSLAENAIAHIQELCSSPPAIREYRMVWRDGETFTRFRLDIDDFTFESPFSNARDSRTGRYYTVTD